MNKVFFTLGEFTYCVRMQGGSEDTEERDYLFIERKEELIVLGTPFLPTYMILIKCH